MNDARQGLQGLQATELKISEDDSAVAHSIE